MSALDVKLALFFTPFTAGGRTSASNAIASDCPHSIIWL